jgi:hypothetical protein
MRAAAGLLSASRTFRGLGELVRAAGLAPDVVEVERDARERLGLDDALEAGIGAGPGSVRVLVLALASGGPLRDGLQRVARRLASRAPHVLWVIAAVDDSGAQAGIVAWSMEHFTPRLASFLWEPAAVVDSDAETLCSIASVRPNQDALQHARYVEVLGRDALTRRFYRALEAQVTALATSVPARVDADTARGVALLYTSRLLFLRFLEAKGWLNGERGFIASRFDDCMARGGRFHDRVLLPLFFGTLNTPPAKRARAARAFGQVPFLNGGLFARTASERRIGAFRFPDAPLGSLFDQLFERFRFVAREDSATWSEASVDPEMLGRAFESLMAGAERRRAGVYYTPHALVARVAEHALAAALPSPTLRDVRELRVLDPACGSGAFLVFMLERLAELRRQLGEDRPVAAVRRDVLARCVFGVDRSPIAVWLCELRLWLSVVIESDETDPQRVSPLPNLDRNIRVGDALAGSGFADAPPIIGSAELAQLRARYIRATGARKRSLARTLDRKERTRVLAQALRAIDATAHARKELLAAQRGRDLFGRRVETTTETRREIKRLRDRLRALRSEHRRIAEAGALPFSFSGSFADVQARGGFDIVLGNPPWVRLHRIPAVLRLVLKEAFEVYRSAPWMSGAAAGRAAVGFASQVDLAALFVERSVSLLRDHGTLSMLLPVKLWRALAGGGLRRFLLRTTRVLRLEDLSESPQAFDAAVYPSILLARAGAAPPPDFPFDSSPGAPWLSLGTDARAAFDRIRAAGLPLSSTMLGSPRLGVKSGCNAAFVVRITAGCDDFSSILSSDGEAGSVETQLLRPALRGDGVSRWVRSAGDDWILWTHDERGAPLARLPDRARLWLRRRYGALADRADAARSRRWWSLFRVEAAAHSTARVVWADFGRRPRALVLPAGDVTVPLNTCYVLRCADPHDAYAIASLLNSWLASAWLNAVAEPARGGYRRYLAWTVGLLPVPAEWPRARAILSGAYGLDDDALLEAALDAYRLRRDDVAALVERPT